MPWYSFTTYELPWLYPFTGTTSNPPWFYPFATGTHGTFTLFGQALTGVHQADTAAYTMGVQFSVNTTGTLNALWFESTAVGDSLPVTIALFAVSGSALVHSEGTSGSPITWSGAAGAGWLRAAFASPPAVTAGVPYIGAVFNSNLSTKNWYSDIAHYWDSGAGSGGITSGSLSAPNSAGSANGQDVFNAGGALTFPATTFSATNYMVDVEVTT